MTSQIRLVVDNSASPACGQHRRASSLRGAGRAVRSYLPENCLGCTTCNGVCAALLEAASLPDAILNRRQRRF